MPLEHLLDIGEASKVLGVSSGTLYVWVCQKRIPYVKIGRLTKFDPKDITAWITERKVEPFEY